MNRPPRFLVLPGVTSNRERRAALLQNATDLWPDARVAVPDYLSRFRGVKGVGAWLERWSSEQLPPGGPFFVFAFILGAAALPYAPGFTSRIDRLVVLRSRYQEGVPRLLRRRFTALGATLIAGRAVAGLGKPPFWPAGFAPSCPTLTLLETRPTSIAQRLGVKELSDAELGVSGAVEVPLDHDAAYFSRALMQTAVDWLKLAEPS